MIELNRLIHDLTQALTNMKLKKELCQDPAQGYTYIISLHQGKVYQSSRRKGVGGMEATLTKYLGKSRKPKTRLRGCIQRFKKTYTLCTSCRLQIKQRCSSEWLITTHKTELCHNPNDHNVKPKRFENITVFDAFSSSKYSLKFRS